MLPAVHFYLLSSLMPPNPLRNLSHPGAFPKKIKGAALEHRFCFAGVLFYWFGVVLGFFFNETKHILPAVWGLPRGEEVSGRAWIISVFLYFCSVSGWCWSLGWQCCQNPSLLGGVEVAAGSGSALVLSRTKIFLCGLWGTSVQGWSSSIPPSWSTWCLGFQLLYILYLYNFIFQ